MFNAICNHYAIMSSINVLTIHINIVIIAIFLVLNAIELFTVRTLLIISNKFRLFVAANLSYIIILATFS